MLFAYHRYLQMLFLLLFSDLYSNQIKLYSHNYTTLPKALKRMWVFYFLHNCLYCLITASFNYSEVFFEFLCHTGESVCVVVDMTDFKCCEFPVSSLKITLTGSLITGLICQTWNTCKYVHIAVKLRYTVKNLNKPQTTPFNFYRCLLLSFLCWFDFLLATI